MKKLVSGFFSIVLASMSFSVFAENIISDTVNTAGNIVNTAVDTTGNIVNNAVDTTGNVVNHTADKMSDSSANGNSSNDGNVFQRMGQTLNDAAITTTIYAKYTADPLVNPLKINVETTNGNVVLTGNVDANAQFERAMQLAAQTDGVKDVSGKNLQVAPSQQFFADSMITLKVKSALLFANSKDFSAWDIHVETNNGVVYLTGTVKNDNGQNEVEQLARGVNGVTDVKSGLTVG